jgi:phosphoribosylaminoimidazolecarboxamide formyltransferase/IMP cyclohydrolase
VYDKTGIAEFASALHQAGWDLVSSGGTARTVSAAGVPVTDIADLTGVPAILDHRVVTLHPKVHGGLLADPTNEQHVADMEEYGIESISLVVSNLYPFGSDATFEHGSGSPVELIDIGGPAMVRASAKNHEHVAIVVDPADYEVVLAEIAAPPARTRCVRAHRRV